MFHQIKGEESYFERNNQSKNYFVPRRDIDIQFAKFSTEKKQWCLNTYNDAKGFLSGMSWGNVPKSCRKIWREKSCSFVIADYVMNKMFQNISSKSIAVQSALEMGYNDFISKPHTDKTNVKMLYFSNEPKVLKYELKYPWNTYICPGTIALDLGTNKGDTIVPMTVATRGGVVIGFESNLGYYMAVE